MSRGNLESLRSFEYHVLIEILQDAWSKSGKSQAAICSELGKPRNYLNKIVRAERRLDFVEAVRLCRVIDADPVEIMKLFTERIQKTDS